MQGRNIRRVLPLLAAVAVFAAGVLPACLPGMCCPAAPAMASMHAEMPCCATSDAVAPRDDARQEPATSTVSTSLLPHVAVAARIDGALAHVRVQTAHDTVLHARPEPSPPLFLLNEQFLI